MILFKIGPAQDARLNVIRGLQGSDRNRRSHKKSYGCHNDYEGWRISTRTTKGCSSVLSIVTIVHKAVETQRCFPDIGEFFEKLKFDVVFHSRREIHDLPERDRVERASVYSREGKTSIGALVYPW